MEKEQKDKLVNDLKDIYSIVVHTIADDIANAESQEPFLGILTWQDCKEWFLSCCDKNKNQAIGGFIISIKENKTPKNDNDRFNVLQALIDINKKPIVVNGETVSRIIHTRTMDDALIRVMNGNEKQIFMK